MTFYPWQKEAFERLEGWREGDIVIPFRPISFGKSIFGKAIHHIDGNPYNNDPANLVIVDIEENGR